MGKDKFDVNRLLKLFTVSLFVLLSIVGFGFAIYLFFVANSIWIYLIAFAFLFLSIVSGFFNILASYWYYKSFDYDKYVLELKRKLGPLKSYPTVSVVMPTHDEDVNMIRRILLNYEARIIPRIRFISICLMTHRKRIQNC